MDDDTSNVDQSEPTNSDKTEEINTAGSSGQSSGSLNGELNTEGGPIVPMDRDEVGDRISSNGSNGPSEQTSTNWEDLMNLTQGSPLDDSTDDGSLVPEEEEATGRQ